MPEPKLTDLDSSVLEHLLYKLLNASIALYPFPHFYIRDIFPPTFYGDFVRKVQATSDYTEVEGRYHGRKFGPDDMPSRIPGLAGFATQRFLRAVLSVFRPQLKERYTDNSVTVYSELRFIRDGRDYFIGPHTDARWKLVSLLFYLPIHNMYERAGTSIYLPKNPKFVCDGGPHYDSRDFTLIHTAPYLPNTLLGFFKTDHSFHGVEPITQDFQRDILLFNLYDSAIYAETHKPSAETPSNADKDETLAPVTPET